MEQEQPNYVKEIEAPSGRRYRKVEATDGSTRFYKSSSDDPDRLVPDKGGKAFAGAHSSDYQITEKEQEWNKTGTKVPKEVAEKHGKYAGRIDPELDYNDIDESRDGEHLTRVKQMMTNKTLQQRYPNKAMRQAKAREIADAVEEVKEELGGSWNAVTRTAVRAHLREQYNFDY